MPKTGTPFKEFGNTGVFMTEIGANCDDPEKTFEWSTLRPMTYREARMITNINPENIVEALTGKCFYLGGPVPGYYTLYPTIFGPNILYNGCERPQGVAQITVIGVDEQQMAKYLGDAAADTKAIQETDLTTNPTNKVINEIAQVCATAVRNVVNAALREENKDNASVITTFFNNKVGPLKLLKELRSELSEGPLGPEVDSIIQAVIQADEEQKKEEQARKDVENLMKWVKRTDLSGD